jgi:hypothetical protein
VEVIPALPSPTVYDPKLVGEVGTSTTYSLIWFYSALITNYIGLLVTACVASHIPKEIKPEIHESWAIITGLLCFLTGQTQFAVLTGLTEGWSWALMTIGFLGYLKRRRWILFAVLSISIVQRELIPVAFLTIGVVNLVKMRWFSSRSTDQLFGNNIDIFTIFASSIVFAIHIVLRKLILPVKGVEQLDISVILQNISSFQVNLEHHIILQNVLLIFLLGIIFIGLVGTSIKKTRCTSRIFL